MTSQQTSVFAAPRGVFQRHFVPLRGSAGGEQVEGVLPVWEEITSGQWYLISSEEVILSTGVGLNMNWV